MTGRTREQFLQKDPSYVPLQRFHHSEFDSDQLNNRYIAYIVLQKPFINEFKEKEAFYSEQGRQFPDEDMTRTDLALVKFYYNAAVRRFLKTFRQFAEKRM